MVRSHPPSEVVFIVLNLCLLKYNEPTDLVKFKANVKIIDAHNAKKLSYTSGVNWFADLSWEEFAATHLGYKSDGNRWGHDGPPALSHLKLWALTHTAYSSPRHPFPVQAP